MVFMRMYGITSITITWIAMRRIQGLSMKVAPKNMHTAGTKQYRRFKMYQCSFRLPESKKASAIRNN